MQHIQHKGLAWYTFNRPAASFRHGLITRQGGASQGPFAALNLGSTVGDDPAAVRKNHDRLFAAWSLTRAQVVSPHQVHGSHVACVTHNDGGQLIPQTDALITAARGLALLLRFADCTPVLFYDPEHHVAGLAHAGWRGVAAGVIPATVRALQTTFGSRPPALWAGIGPAISALHYEVGAEVVTAVREAVPADIPIATPDGERWRLDMARAVTAQLHAAGVQNIELSGFCTASNTAEWYSHRAEAGKTGRFGVLVMLA